MKNRTNLGFESLEQRIVPATTRASYQPPISALVRTFEQHPQVLRPGQQDVVGLSLRVKATQWSRLASLTLIPAQAENGVDDVDPRSIRVYQDRNGDGRGDVLLRSSAIFTPYDELIVGLKSRPLIGPGRPLDLVVTFGLSNAPTGQEIGFEVASVNLRTLRNRPVPESQIHYSGEATVHAIDRPQADVSIAMSGPSTIAAGDQATFNIVVSNAGPAIAHDVQVDVALPHQFAFVGSSSSVGWVLEDSYLHLRLPEIGAGQTRSEIVAIQVMSTGSDSAVNTVAQVSEGSGDPVTSNNVAWVTTTFVVPNSTKIIAVKNANPDADATNVPTGVSPVGQFKFIASPNTDSTVVLSSLSFLVTAENVAIDASSFRLYNKANASVQYSSFQLSMLDGYVSNTTVTGTFRVTFVGLENSMVDTQIGSGMSQTFVLGMNVTNAKIVASKPSSLRTVLDLAVLEWLDQDGGTLQRFQGLDLSDLLIGSTKYQS